MSKPDAFVSGIFAQWGDDLLRFLTRRVRTEADARDLAQEAYVRLLRLNRKDVICDPRSYVYRVAANLAHEFQLKRRAEVDGLKRWADEVGVDSEAGDSDADSSVVSERVTQVLKGLSPKCRAVLVMHRRDGMTYDEIAERLGISSSMVKKYLASGLRHCRRHLDDCL
ncbi:RNA polymerase sigma factor [Steroidobacter sp.]|uniref:RNA polymerase sigma factor n=1 Tax=Steroidobacter sp. TaxID=1978227 RepID=UPI001A517292|nr:RNA polymerase sigma factor [Steroidobacter sp.]MBL8271090.1 RNA polymerase sigma factor [Steroidobacter sp.]